MIKNVLGNAKLRETLQNYLFVLPALLLFATFYIYPVYKVFELSLFEYDGITPVKYFVGLNNFKDAMGNKIWWTSMWNAAYITILALVLQNALTGLLLIGLLLVTFNYQLIVAIAAGWFVGLTYSLPPFRFKETVAAPVLYALGVPYRAR